MGQTVFDLLGKRVRFEGQVGWVIGCVPAGPESSVEIELRGPAGERRGLVQVLEAELARVEVLDK